MCFIWGPGPTSPTHLEGNSPTSPTHLEGNTLQLTGMQVTQVLKRNVYVSPSMAATLTPGQGLGGVIDAAIWYSWYLGLGTQLTTTDV